MSKPIAELARNSNGTPVLGLYNLSPQHFETLQPALQQNGDQLIHTLRSIAGAHLSSWSPTERLVEVVLHGPEPWLFVHAVCNFIGISSGRIPNVISEALPN